MRDKKLIKKYDKLILEEKRTLDKLKEEYSKLRNDENADAKQKVLLEIDIEASKKKVRFLVTEQRKYQ